MTKDRRIDIGADLDKLNSIKETEDYVATLAQEEIKDLLDVLEVANEYGILTQEQQILRFILCAQYCQEQCC